MIRFFVNLRRGGRALGLLALAALASHLAAATPTAVPTMHCIGLYWAPTGGSTTNACTVQYRPTGTSTWFNGSALWFDSNTIPNSSSTPPATKDSARINEYRGSLFDLLPGQQYDIQLTLGSGTTTGVFTATTMNETFPESTPTVVPTQSTTYTITTGGTATSYKVYDGQGHTIDVANAANTCVTINASYVILRNLTLKGATIHGIQISDNNRNHIVIENCDISGWGQWDKDSGGSPTAKGEYGDSGIYANVTTTLSDLVIQRNTIHDPRTRSNSWHTSYLLGQKGGPPSNGHPNGPQGITILSPGATTIKGNLGHNIIRYNHIYSTDGKGDVNNALAGHGFDDGIGGSENVSLYGFPGRDSDVYGNEVSNCWDDGLEIEGGGMNVRVFGNYVHDCFSGISAAGLALGPLYTYRNVIGFSRYDPIDPSVVTSDVSIDAGATYPEGGSLFKIGETAYDYVHGHHYLVGNTSTQPTYTDTHTSATRPGGVNSGITTGPDSGGREVWELYSRNNILQVQVSTKNSVRIYTSEQNDPTLDLDYDFGNGVFDNGGSDETHKKTGTPVYNGSSPNPNAPEQTSASAGYNTAQTLNNFSDFFNLNGGPDIGAVEAGKSGMVFGPTADWTSFVETGIMLTVTTPSLANGTVGTAYSQTLAAMGGTTPYTWSILTGTLPGGLTLHGSTGVIDGTPTGTGTSTFTVEVTDSASHTATKSLSITVVSSYLFYDDFEDGNYTGWTVVGPGSWSVVTDGAVKAYKQSTATTTSRSWAGTTTWTNYAVTARARVDSWNSGSSGRLGVMARYDASGHFYLMYFNSVNNKVVIQYYNGTSYSTLATSTATWTPDTSYHTFELDVSGSSLTAKIDGTTYVSATDSNITAGAVGVYTNNQAAYFDVVSAQ